MQARWPGPAMAGARLRYGCPAASAPAVAALSAAPTTRHTGPRSTNSPHTEHRRSSAQAALRPWSVGANRGTSSCHGGSPAPGSPARPGPGRHAVRHRHEAEPPVPVDTEDGRRGSTPAAGDGRGYPTSS